MGQYYSMSYPRVTLRFTLGCLTLAALSGLVYRQIQVCLDVKVYTYFTCKTGRFYILYLFIIYFLNIIVVQTVEDPFFVSCVQQIRSY